MLGDNIFVFIQVDHPGMKNTGGRDLTLELLGFSYINESLRTLNLISIFIKPTLFCPKDFSYLTRVGPLLTIGDGNIHPFSCYYTLWCWNSS